MPPSFSLIFATPQPSSWRCFGEWVKSTSLAHCRYTLGVGLAANADRRSGIRACRRSIWGSSGHQRVILTPLALSALRSLRRSPCSDTGGETSASSSLSGTRASIPGFRVHGRPSPFEAVGIPARRSALSKPFHRYSNVRRRERSPEKPLEIGQSGHSLAVVVRLGVVRFSRSVFIIIDGPRSMDDPSKNRVWRAAKKGTAAELSLAAPAIRLLSPFGGARVGARNVPLFFHHHGWAEGHSSTKSVIS